MQTNLHYLLAKYRQAWILGNVLESEAAQPTHPFSDYNQVSLHWLATGLHDGTAYCTVHCMVSDQLWKGHFWDDIQYCVLSPQCCTLMFAVHSILHMDSPEESLGSNAESRGFSGSAPWHLEAALESPGPSPGQLSTPQLLKQIARDAATEVLPMLCTVCHLSRFHEQHSCIVSS